MNFTQNDINQIEKKGLTVDKVLSQIALFKKGVPFVNLKSTATIGNGILAFNEREREDLIKLFDNKRDTISIMKFVPASGAATRMFKTLFTFLKEYNPQKESINSYINKNKEKELSVFFVGLEKLPFFEEVVTKIHKSHPNYNELSYDEQRLLFVKTMLDENLLNYSSFPKGLLPFHRYREHSSTAFEEHLFEAAEYASSNRDANLHFTISEKHKDKFDEEFKYIEEDVEEKTQTKFNITFSYQKHATDTIAVTTTNEPFRDDNGMLVFRPSGHGALIENLNEIDTDIIFIKNIDNVVVNKYKGEVAKYKKMLAGVILKIQKNAFEYEESLNYEITNEKLLEIADFLSSKMNIVLDVNFNNLSLHEKKVYLKNKLNRPIRVCGMVKNEGEPGGGPFWVKNSSDNISLQIVESAQIDKKNPDQNTILKNATHFNPVDLVCSVKNHKGEKFDLTKYVDSNTAFITMKTKTGKDLKALELPGLWNGSMAYWNTIFVEVPLITFNPVKTVNDLLKAPHQIK
ncbi:DUF4301 family protein [Flavobacteriaceae bacterium S0825]|uniref:DUF4301 family protein n=1 Tax=Gaetbulibacter sp. S0825 TaxID=2720084 RepID=UPI00142F88F6|nr:DUF4301 family protein [Gaetbulibacter sp. S0825]MCK0107983.1 DUF4301 family protein [Flavobacteriaceae bacterium S0825]NIX63619.1 DUF4301 family protein [Gaetbulibacter sp. S0825]